MKGLLSIFYARRSTHIMLRYIIPKFCGRPLFRGFYSEDRMLRPFLRWAGGKQKLVKLLLPFVPSEIKNRTYYEPFLGGGSLFFALQPTKAIISDINTDLIECYQGVAAHPELVSNSLKAYVDQDSSEFYYNTRLNFAVRLPIEEQAARFIYINKSAFNGIYRVNSKGQFNVPYGPSPNGPAIPSLETLVSASHSLKGAKIISGEYKTILKTSKKDDFIYLDPPYPPRSKTAYFNHYSSTRFDWGEQERLAEYVTELDKRGCLIMISNADKKSIIDLYRGLTNFRIAKLPAIRWLGSNGDRFRVREIVITNYAIEGNGRK